MRVSTVGMQQFGLNAILDQQAKMSRTELQLASGKRVVNPSDDPASAALVLNIKQSLGIARQQMRNGEVAREALGFEETVLDGVTHNLQRARELAIQGMNETYGPKERRAIAAEIREIHDSILGVANSRNGDGEHIFAGESTDQPPYVVDEQGNLSYRGDEGQRMVQIGPERKIAAGDSGSTVFGAIALDGAGVPLASDDPGYTENVFGTLGQLADALESGDLSALNPIERIDAALDRVVNVVSAIGSRVNAVENNLDMHDAYLVKMEETLSSINDLDYAEAISRFNLEQVGLQAAQQAFIKIQGLSLFNQMR